MLFLTVAAQSYVLPSVYPSTDQTVMIPDNLIQVPFIQDAIAIVKSKVSASLLNAAVSTYRPSAPSSPTYNGNAQSMCYWPATQCVRSSKEGVEADVSTCPGQNQWDDGPTNNANHASDSTALRNALDAQNIKATFFLVGSNVIQNPAVVKAHYDSGHELALHTWYSSDIDDRVRAIAQALGFRVVLWNRDSEDASQSSTGTANAQNVGQIIKSWFSLTSGFVSLQHDISQFTTGVAIQALADLKASGSAVQPMTVGKCIGEASYQNSAPVVVTTSARATVSSAASTAHSVVQSSVQASVSSQNQVTTSTPLPTVKAGNVNAAMSSTTSWGAALIAVLGLLL
ncbi:hypothetical protein EDD86DRAFT_250319 [Gorgonomyces haynaldii]|nr:hypothetical protein EDD86DRAFT_250319 [Gorgonomyces haynaldii]